MRIGRALSFGRRAFLYSSGTALMMSTNLGTPEKPCFLLRRALTSLRERERWASWAAMSSDAMAEVTRSRTSVCDGALDYKYGYN